MTTRTQRGQQQQRQQQQQDDDDQGSHPWSQTAEDTKAQDSGILGGMPTIPSQQSVPRSVNVSPSGGQGPAAGGAGGGGSGGGGGSSSSHHSTLSSSTSSSVTIPDIPSFHRLGA